jgi:hypothetical protein
MTKSTTKSALSLTALGAMLALLHGGQKRASLARVPVLPIG